MPLLVYRPNPADHTHENEEFRKVCKVLKRKFRTSDQLCVLAGNMNVYGKEYDAFVITPYSIVLLEFKDYGGHIVAAENGAWVAQNGERNDIIKGGAARKNPFDQARTNKSTFITALVEAGIKDDAARKLVALVLFHKPITLDNHLSAPVQKWLHISDVNHFNEKIEDIVNPSLDLSSDEILTLIDKLGIQEQFLDREYSNCEFIAQSASGDNACEVEIPAGVKAYVDTVHSSRHIDAPYEIFSCEKGHPDVPFDITKQYLVRVQIEPSAELIERFAKIGVEADGDGDYLYWELGEAISIIHPRDIQASTDDNQLRFRKNVTRLPAWLDDYLFSERGCTYNPNHQRFSFNADLSPEEVSIYAGTYLPRSYAESFLIFDNLLTNSGYKRSLMDKDSISIVSLGAGTGGDVIGILVALDKYIPYTIPTKICAIDENKYSLDLFEDIVHRYQRHSKRMVSFTRYTVAMRCLGDLMGIATKTPESSVDILTCSKACCEFAGRDVFDGENPYEMVLDAYSGKIKATGVMSLVDVTTPTSDGQFLPVILNTGVNSYLKKNRDMSSLLPLSCGCFETECDIPCFFRQDFLVHHCKKKNDLSKICYRLVSKKQFCDLISPGSVDKKYVMGKDDDGKYYFCPMTEQNEFEADSFNAKN